MFCITPSTTAPDGRSATAPAIEVRGLRKHYGALQAVRGIDLHVQRGEVFAFLGPNGAGKTSTVEILEGFRRANAGHVRVLGEDPGTADAAWRGRIGVVLQESEPDPGLTVREVAALYAGYHAHPRGVDETLALVGLHDRSEQLATALSGGQRRRLDLALALIGRPELLFLDEPTTGFDPAARRVAWQLIRDLRSQGTTVFLTTHAMDEAAELADRIAVIAGGTIVAEGTPAALGGRDEAPATISFALIGGAAALPPALAARARGNAGGNVEISSPQPLQDLAELGRFAADTATELVGLEVRRPTLEDVYLTLTGGPR
jgi:ABC-2 type transport system ATP-binding protein